MLLDRTLGLVDGIAVLNELTDIITQLSAKVDRELGDSVRQKIRVHVYHEDTVLGHHEYKERLTNAVEFIKETGQPDGGHHLVWVIDQITRILVGNDYPKFLAEFCDGEDGPCTYDWKVGIPP